MATQKENSLHKQQKSTFLLIRLLCWYMIQIKAALGSPVVVMREDLLSFFQSMGKRTLLRILGTPFIGEPSK